MMQRLLPSIRLEAPAVAVYGGRLVGASGLLLEAVGCSLVIGQRCQIESGAGEWIHAQMVGFQRDVSYLMPYKLTRGLAVGARVLPLDGQTPLMIGEAWLGRVLNGLGEAIDGAAAPVGDHPLASTPPAVNPFCKQPVAQPLDVGVRAVNALLTIGRGQRVGLFAGSGVGKSVLLSMMARQTEADVVVVGLIGERGREVREFVTEALGAEGLAKSVLIVATADESPLMRLRATELCHAVGAHFRDQGKHVLMLVDSLTRYAMAQREIALALGEPPATKGYPPSAFAMLPRLVEGAGNGEGGLGSMTAIYTVLAEGDDQQDPVADTARAILDGHIVLSRELAEQGHYPSIDIGASISRCMNQIIDGEHRQAALQLKASWRRYQDIRSLLPLGAHVAGADSETDLALMRWPQIRALLCQDAHEAASFADSRHQLLEVFNT